MEILKADKKICEQLNPGVEPQDYFCSPLKTFRVISFKDRTILIETKCSGGDVFKMIKSTQPVTMLSQEIDKEGRIVTMFKYGIN